MTATPAAHADSPLRGEAAAAGVVDLGAALAVDGTFIGTEGLSGTIDTHAWSLVSDLASGEPPRFAPATSSAGVVDPAGNEWLGLGSNGAGNGALNGTVLTMRVGDLGLIAGGTFTNAAGIPEADYIARWDGYEWLAMGSNGAGTGALNGPVRALEGSHHGLIVAGDFTNAGGASDADYIALWTGDVWAGLPPAPVADGVLNGPVHALAINDLDLIVGGSFTNAAGIAAADYVATWDGWNWSALGSSGSAGALNGQVRAITVLGSHVYVGGDFTNAAGIAQADYLARWNGTAWSALGSNGAEGALNGQVRALAILGSSVYVGGAFTNAAGIAQADYLARWNGSSWSALGSNGSGNGALGGSVNALAVWGSTLYVGGAFTNAAGIAQADYLARWNGSSWSALGSNGSGNGALGAEVQVVAISSSAVYIGGAFANAGGNPTADRLALAIMPGPWAPLGSNGDLNGSLDDDVNALAIWKGELYVGGMFTDAGGVAEADFIARWNGSSWSALGSNGPGNGALNNGVTAITPTSDALYVGGFFTNAAGNSRADYLARWNGSAWSALGSNGGSNGALNDSVRGIATSGTSVYAVGFFTNAGGDARADHIARWNGSSWSPVGTGPDGSSAVNQWVSRVAVLGNDVYIGGSFLGVGGVANTRYIAVWNGHVWRSLDSNGAGGPPLNGAVHTLLAWGTSLYVGGDFTNAGGKGAADYVARWQNDSWSALGSNGAGNGVLTGRVSALAVVGNHVYVGGNFSDAAGLGAADRVARWDGSKWTALGSNGAGDGVLDRAVSALAIMDEKIYVGGRFQNANGIPMADFAAAYGPIPASKFRPDGRIRKGSGTLVGNNIYNTDGTGQSRSGKAAVGSTVTFTISIQNDGPKDRFNVVASGAPAAGYRVRFLHGTSDVTVPIVEGTYRTPALAKGEKHVIKVRVTVLSGATVGSSVTRLATITSRTDPTRSDAVKLTVRRG